jgi:hypothetical protein
MQVGGLGHLQQQESLASSYIPHHIVVSSYKTFFISLLSVLPSIDPILAILSIFCTTCIQKNANMNLDWVKLY